MKCLVFGQSRLRKMPQVQVDPPKQGKTNNKGMPVPKKLGVSEDYQSITAWEVSVRNFYRRDEV